MDDAMDDIDGRWFGGLLIFTALFWVGVGWLTWRHFG